MSESGVTSRRAEWLAFWERREVPFFTALPYPLLFLCAVFDLATRHGLGRGTEIDLGLAAIAAVVMAAIDRRDRRPNWTSTQTVIRPANAAIAFTVVAALSAALVIRDPLFGFYAWTGYFWVWRLLWGRLRFVGVALVAVTLAISQTGSGPYRSATEIAGLCIVCVIDFCIAGGLTWFGWVGNEQQLNRAQELSALTEANAKLEQSLRLNAELHEQLVSQAREAGVSDERRRMAREIHDTLAQGLTGIITQLQAAQSLGAGGAGTEAGARHIDAAVSLARESLTEARRSVQALTPEPLVGARLPDAVQDVAERWSVLHEVPVAFTTTGTARTVRPDIEVALLRTAQEALANVAKHAGASRVGLTLSYMEDLVTLDVRDDGVGFLTVNGTGPRRPRDAHGGFGLGTMRQRIEEVGGRLEIEAEPGSGTAISAAVPVAAGGAAP